jgi:hypothetical protein
LHPRGLQDASLLRYEGLVLVRVGRHQALAFLRAPVHLVEELLAHRGLEVHMALQRLVALDQVRLAPFDQVLEFREAHFW